MPKYNLQFLILFFFSLLNLKGISQSLGVNTSGAPAHNSAILDVSSTNKGILVPRMTKAQKDAIASPATGLLVYQDGPDSIGFHFYNGSGWAWIDTASGKAGWALTGNSGTNSGEHFFGTTDDVPLSFRQNNAWLGRLNRSPRLYFIGDSAGISITSGYNNVGIGAKALNKQTTAYANVAIGNNAFQNNVTNLRNTVVGDSAMHYLSYNPGGNYFGDNTAVGSKALISMQPTSVNDGGKNTAIGSESMYLNTTGYENTALGVSALRSNITGAGNTALGRSAARLSSKGNLNTYIGYVAGYHDSTSSGNTGVGGYALYRHQTANNYNTAIGYEAMQNDSAGGANTAAGWRSLRNNKTGIDNSAFGVGALEHSFKGSFNTAMGRSAGFLNDSSNYTVSIGYTAGQSNKRDYNISIGAYAGYANSYSSANLLQGAENTMVGYQTLTGNAFGSQNVAIGFKAMSIATPSFFTLTAPSRNVAVGDSALQAGRGNDNVSVGYRALSMNNYSGHTAMGSRALLNSVSNYPNTAIGYSSQDSLVSGIANTSMGAWSLTSNKFGSNNTAIGNWAMKDAYNPTGANFPFDNTAVGNDALRSTRYYGNTAVGAGVLRFDTSGTYNTAIGFLSMAENRNGYYNAALGTSALRNIISGGGNTALGTNTMYNKLKGDFNTAVGYESMIMDTAGLWNTAVGWRSLRYNRTGNENTAIGVGALEFSDSSLRNTAIGRGAMIGVPGSKGTMGNVVVGFYAAANMDSASRTVLLGYNTGYNNQADENVFVGYNSGYGAISAITGHENTGLGTLTLTYLNSGRSNTALGYGALFNLRGGTNNTGVGVRTMVNVTNASYNTSLGDSSLFWTSGNYNNAVGHKALQNNTSGTENVGLGSFNLSNTSNGSFNTAVGNRAGMINNTGSYNSYFGYGTSSSTTNFVNTTAIGALAYVSQNNSMVLGSINGVNGATADTKVGIGTSTPDSTFSVADKFMVGNSGTIQYDNSVPVMSYMFRTGSTNLDRMIISHSPAFPTYGLQYQDIGDRFNFLSNGTNVATISLGSQRVGIGTDVPSTKLHIYEPTATAVNARISSFSNDYEPGLEFVKTGALGTDWKFRVGAASNTLIISTGSNDFATTPTDEYEFTGTSFRPYTDGSNFLGLSANRWNTVYALNGTINTSDARDKENITDLNYGLNEIMQLRPVSYTWKNNPGSTKKLGFIAQEVKPILNEVVQVGDDLSVTGDDGKGHAKSDKLGIFYSDIIPVTVKAIQEQQQQIQKLKEENEALKQKNESLENDIRIIKQRLGIN